MFFWEGLKNLDEEFALSPRSAAIAQNLGWSEAEPQDRESTKGRAPRSGRQPFIISTSQLLGYRTLRALRFLTQRHPGVPLRSTPGFMLAPAARVLEDLNPH
jgi:hypothetical protein